MEEIWKDIYYFNKPTNELVDYRGLYQVSNLGRIRSLDRYVRGYNHGHEHVKLIKGMVLRARPNMCGYPLAHISKNGTHKYYSLHRLVFFSFNPDADTTMEVNHIDENKMNASLDNLCLMSSSENCRWGTRSERIRGRLSGVKKGPMSEEHRKKISEGNKQSPKHKKAVEKVALANSKTVAQYTKNGEYIATFVSAAEVERVLEIKAQSVNACCHFKRPSAGNYVWRFV